MTACRLFSLFVLLAFCARAQEPEGSSKTRPREEGGALSAAEFAAQGMTGSSVGIALDDQGRVYVSHTNRRNNGELDIRTNKTWLLESLALTSAEDRQALIRKKLPDTWQDLAKVKERIICVEDTDGDGKADKRTVAFEGFNDLGNGLAGGVLWHDGALYVTVMPSLYKLTDKDGDGVFETKEELVRGLGYHIGYGGHDMHGPTLGMDGRIYWSMGDKGISVKLKDARHIYYPGQGGVFRIEPDGSGFEVFAHGLRNPQELAFDEYGNLFTVDNDGDFGDKERLVYIMEGSDSAWRMHYQYRSDRSWGEMAGYNPWLVDNLWKPVAAGQYQPAYFTPPLDNFSVGPIGLEYNPGTALSERFRNTFFLAESSKDVQAFKTEPVGAGFKMKDAQIVLTGPFITGLFFGPDGALYGADWGNNEWAPHENGRVLKLDDGEATHDSQRESVRKLIAEGMAKHTNDELTDLLGHADQRIRLKAQFELVRRNDFGALTLIASRGQGETPLVARVHALWGLGQLGRKDNTLMLNALPLLADKDAEIRAQTVRMMSDADYKPAAEQIGELLADPSPRVRSLAGVALFKLGSPAQFDPAVTMLAANNDEDKFVRHGGMMALAGSDHARLALLATHASKAVRLTAVVAARQVADPGAAAFLNDTDTTVVGEAARAIHDDLSIPEALPALAKLLERTGITDEAALRRAISANIRVGDQDSAHRLMDYALRKEAPSVMRAEALETLALWPVGLAFDRVQGNYRNLPKRDAKFVAPLFAKGFESLLSENSRAIQTATAKVVRALNYQPAIDKLTSMALDEKAEVEIRSMALEAIAVARAPKLPEAIALALKSELPALRVAAISALVESKPEDKQTYAAINAALKRGVIEEQQPIFVLLSNMRGSQAEKVIGTWAAQLAEGKAPDGLALDIYEAALATKSKDLKKALKPVDSKLKKKKFGAWSLALEGGNADEGKAIFGGSTTAACMQCHTMTAGLPSVGPDLSHVAARLTPDHLLQAVVDPQSEIAEGYGLISATLKNGALVSGLLAKESDKEIVLRMPATTITSTVAKADVASRTQPASAMPVMTSLLTKMEVRNIVAYLKTLK
ncbi:MAG: hypothetical protein JWO08_704 [Verrucomicrobiaceae bacterium]|nr:hypothetical protein [Verrucomicrobiaceae bacterium]